MKSVEQRYEKAGRFQFILAIIGCLFFLINYLSVSFWLGFYVRSSDNQPHVYENPIQSFSIAELWVYNVLLGMIGGILLNYRRFIIAGISGMAASAGIVGFTLLYIGWRDSYENFECLFMIGIGMIPGIVLLNYMERKFPKKIE